jgi:hypothetical protein
VAKRHFLSTKNGSTQIKFWDAQIRGGIASCSNRRSSGRPKGLTSDVEKNIPAVFDEDDKRTFREAA